MFRVFACFALLMLCLALGCTSSQSATPEKGKALPPWAPDWQKDGLTPEQRDSTARASLEASEKWRTPTCRWLEHGPWVLAWADETLVYRAAQEAGYIEMEVVGQGNRVRPEPAYKITLTELGKTETADCKTDSQGKPVWGVPVSRRKLVAFEYAKEGPNYSGVTYFQVTNEWQLTVVGEKLKDSLTPYGYMKPEQGTWHTTVMMKRIQNKWYVDDLGEVGYYHPQKW